MVPLLSLQLCYRKHAFLLKQFSRVNAIFEKKLSSFPAAFGYHFIKAIPFLKYDQNEFQKQNFKSLLVSCFLVCVHHTEVEACTSRLLLWTLMDWKLYSIVAKYKPNCRCLNSYCAACSWLGLWVVTTLSYQEKFAIAMHKTSMLCIFVLQKQQKSKISFFAGGHNIFLNACI